MDCIPGVHTVEAPGVVRTQMLWTVMSVQQQAIRQDQGRPAFERLGGGDADLLDLQGIFACSTTLSFEFYC